VYGILADHRVAVPVDRLRQRHKRRTRRRSPFVGTGREQLDERAERRMDGVVVSISRGQCGFGLLETIKLSSASVPAKSNRAAVERRTYYLRSAIVFHCDIFFTGASMYECLCG